MDLKIGRILINEHPEVEVTAGRVRPLRIAPVDTYPPGPFRERNPGRKEVDVAGVSLPDFGRSRSRCMPGHVAYRNRL